MDEVIKSLVEENKRLHTEIQSLRQSTGARSLQTRSKQRCSLLEFDADGTLQVPEVVRLLGDALHLVLEGTAFGLSFWDIDKLKSTYTKVYDREAGNSTLKDILENQDMKSTPEAIYMMEMKNRILRGGASQKRDFTVEKPGETASFSVVCEPVFQNAKFRGVVTILLDNTSQETMKAQLRKLRAETEQWERTERHLRQAIKSADEAMEAKNTFLAVMSHEIRTPLNGVLGMAQVLATTSLDPEQKELVHAMVFSGDVLLAIISDILDLSKIEAGTMKLEEMEFDPRVVIKHVARTARAARKDRGIRIEVDISDEVPATVIGDPLRLKQVITNLVFNAVKFTKEGHVRIELKVLKDSQDAKKYGFGKMSDHSSQARLPQVATDNWDVLLESVGNEVPFLGNGDENLLADKQDQELYHTARMLEAIPEDTSSEQDCKTHDDEDCRAFVTIENQNCILLQFAVEDTGIGIPEDAFPSLFEKLTQVHSSTTRKYGGTGLGLAICKQLVELMGGQIFVSSRVGEGSTFSFTLSCKCTDNTQALDQQFGQTNLEKNASYTTAHFHKLQAGLSPTASGDSTQGGLVTTSCCPSASNSGDDNGRTAFVQGNSSSKSTKAVVLQLELSRAGRLRRTSSGPPRIECALMADVEDSKNAGMALSSCSWRPRLLLAEDNKVNVLVAMSMLKRLGLTADVAFNGQEAIAAIQATSYDLVFMDVCMPVLDGLEVTRRVRRFERTGNWEMEDNINNNAKQSHELLQQSRRLPIVAMTASAHSGFEQQCVEYGMDSFLTKPITFRKLRSVLQLFLKQS